MKAADRALLIDLAATVRRLESEIRALRSEIAAGRAAPPSADDTALVAAIGATVGDAIFTAAELLTHADLDAELLAALVAANATATRQLGKIMQRVSGHDLGGLQIERVARERGGTLWRVVQVR